MLLRAVPRTITLAGIAGTICLLVGPAKAEPAADWASYAPAVDAVNSKFDGFGGRLANRSIYGSRGAFTVPLGGQFGAQFDGAAGSFDHRFFGSGAGHLFWRDPARGLLGVYANHTHWSYFGGLHVTQVGGETEIYLGRWTLQGVAGAEMGNSQSRTTVSSITSAASATLTSTATATTPATTTIPPGLLTGGSTTTTTTTTATTIATAIATTSTTTATFTELFEVKTRFFDKVDLAYYLTDDWKTFVGHRYLGGKHAAAVGTEYALRLGGGIEMAAFVEGRVGENSFHGVWGGLKFYFGPNDKPLIVRHRREDPQVWQPDPLFSITNGHSTNGTIVPNTTTTTTTTTNTTTTTTTNTVPIPPICTTNPFDPRCD
jgi:hypothetical protein